jgi:hypothetical protein
MLKKDILTAKVIKKLETVCERLDDVNHKGNIPRMSVHGKM